MSATPPHPPSPAGPATVPRLHLAFLDGLRALAALWVLFFHFDLFEYGLKAPPGWRGVASDWVLYGHLAVDVFIVLSGFCLTIPVAHDGVLKGGALPFFARRARRILPPFYAAMILGGLVHWAGRRMGHHDVITVPGVLANLLMLQDLFPTLSVQFDPPSWSVGAEWKIYFLFPALVWLLRRSGPRAMLGLTALLGLGFTALLYALRPDTPLAYTCPWYVFLFGMGVCAGWAALRPAPVSARAPWPPALGAAVLLAGMLRAWPVNGTDMRQFNDHLPLIDPVAGALTACVLAGLTLAPTPSRAARVRSLLSWRPLVVCGTFAYSIYLVHFLALGALLGRLAPHLTRVPVSVRGDVSAVVCIPLSLAASFLFFLACERPFLVMRRRESLVETARDAVVSPAP